MLDLGTFNFYQVENFFYTWSVSFMFLVWSLHYTFIFFLISKLLPLLAD